MKYRIKSSLIEPSWFEQAIFDTLKMYDAGDDLTNSPLNEFQRNYKTWGGRHRSLIVDDLEAGIKERQKNFIELYESIKRNGYKSIEPLFVWFDDDGFIRIYDGHHRLSICRYLGIDPEMEVSTEWSSKGIDPSEIVGRDFPLREKLMGRFGGKNYMYHHLPYEKRLSDFGCQRYDSEDRWEFISKNIIGKSVFDIGCSEGYFSHKAAAQGFEVSAAETDRMLVSVARYLATTNNLAVKCYALDWKDIIREHRVFFDNIFYLSVLHNEVNAIGKDRAFENLKLFRGKTKRLFVEIPDIKAQKDWAFAFNPEEFIPQLEKLTGLQLKEIYQGYRPIILLENKLYV